MSPLQLRLARTALGLSVREAAELTGTSHFTVTRIEKGDEAKDSTVLKMRTAFEAAGIIFVDENGEGPGVRLRKQKVGSHPEPAGPATEAFKGMEAAIAKDAKKKKSLSK